MRARYDWFNAVSEVYSQVMFGTVSCRLAEHGMYFTTHLWEESLLGQALLARDPMRVYRAVSMPGIDHLRRDPWNARTYKEAQSVAEFEGKRFMCEILGCAGWETTPLDYRRSLNNALAMSVSHIVPHGVYSDRRHIENAHYAPDFFDWHPAWHWMDQCRFPEVRPEGKFQYIHCLSDGGWGYNDYEIYRSAGWMIGELGKARSWGGHFVANVGPRADGTLPEVYYYRMKQIKAWMDAYADVVFNVEEGAWPNKSNVPVTVRNGEWFVLPDWRVDYPIEIRDVDEPASLTLYDGTPLEYRYEGRSLVFQIPWTHKHNYTDPVRLRFKK